MPNPYVGSGFDQYIGTRQKAGQNQVEFYNTQNPQQLAFANPQELATFAQTISGNNAINADNVFSTIQQGFTPRAAALQQITDSLNQSQQQTFGEQSAPKRASSSLTESIAAENNTINDALAEFNILKSKLTGLQAPNYQQAYTDARTQAGLPQIETDVANSQKAIRELPYVNRMNSGNAGVMTEGQLGADTAQKGIPLEIQQANALDRLKLAESFVQNSLKFKEMDNNAARASLQEALNLVGETINLSRTRLSDLTTKEQEQQKREELGQAFAFENRITSPFYDIGGTVYRTSDRMPAHNQAEYVAMGGKGDFSDVQKVTPRVDPVELSPGQTLIDPTTGKVIYQAPNKPTSSGSGGGGSGTFVTADGKAIKLTNTQIDNINPLVTSFNNSPITQNYNTIAEGFQFAQSMPNDTKNPADDQALIYALAKALDPGSVVREGEYATAQKYAQSLVQSYGKSVTQALSGSGFLSQDARRNIKATIENRFRASEQNYQNLFNETARRVELVGGLTEGAGSQFLNNYSGGYSVGTSSASKPGDTNFVGPVFSSSTSNNQPAQQASEQKTQGFWSKAANWLWGSN